MALNTIQTLLVLNTESQSIILFEVYSRDTWRAFVHPGALHKMVDAAEEALKAIQERDRLTAQLK